MNPWEKYQSPNNATTAPAPAGIIRGAPKQPDRFEVEDQQIKRQAANRADIASQRADRSLQLQEQSAQRTAQKDNLEIEKARQEQASINDAKIHTIGSLRKTIAELKQIRDDTQGDWFETGTTGNIARAIPLVGNDAKALSGRLVGIKGQNAFAALEDLEAKGIKLTPISNAEIDLAAASIANLDPSLNEEAFLGQLDKASSFYNDLLAKLEAETGNTQPNQSIEQTPNQSGFEGDESRGPEVVIREGGDVLQNPTGGGETADLNSQGGFKFLQEGESHSDAQKQLITSFFEQNRGNQSLSSFEALQFLRDNNIPIGDRDILEQRINEAKSGKEVNPIFSQSDYDAFISDRADRTENEETLLGISDNKAGFGTRAQEGLLLGFNDEIAGVGGGLGRLLSGGEFGEGYQLQRDVQRELNDRANQRTGLAGDVVEIGAGLALPGSAAGTSLRSAAKTGAGFGAVGGFGYGEGASGSATNALIGAGGGALLGAGGQRIGNALVNRAANKADRKSQSNALAQSADNLGVDLIPADTGGPLTKRLTSGASQGALSSNSVNRAAAKRIEQLGDAANNVADDVGKRLPDDEAGIVIKDAAKRFTAETSQRASRLYDRAEKAASGVKIKTYQANKLIDENITKLSELGGTNKAIIKELETLRNDIANGVSVSGLRQARTRLSQGTFDGKLRSSADKKIYKDVINTISQDIEAGLANAGRGDALQSFKAADAFWKDRVQYIDDTLEPIVGGKKSGEQIVRSIELMAEGKGRGVKTLSGLMKSLNPKEKSDIQATVIHRMGLARAGQQGVDGDSFSSDVFLTNWNKMSAKGKATLLPDGEHRKALSDIARVAEGFKETGRYSNFSNSGGVPLNQVGGAAALFYLEPISLVLAGGAQHVSGKLLASPKFAKLLSGASKGRVSEKSFNSRLGQIAKAEPALAGDIQLFQNFIAQAANDNASRAAAENER